MTTVLKERMSEGLRVAASTERPSRARGQASFALYENILFGQSRVGIFFKYKYGQCAELSVDISRVGRSPDDILLPTHWDLSFANYDEISDW